MPLYALSLGFDAAEVGILVGAHSIAAMFLSIHRGVLMDRFGTRRSRCFCMDQHGPGIVVSPGAMVLELVGLATRQQRRGVVRVDGGSTSLECDAAPVCSSGKAARGGQYTDQR